MFRYRFLTLLLVLGLLVACDDNPAPAPKPAVSPTSAPEVQPPQPPAPPARDATKPAEAAAKQAPPVLPALGSQVVKDTSLPKPEDSKPKPASKVSSSKPLPPARLDLRLPPGLVEQLQPDESAEVDFSPPSLLPEMFVEKPKEPGPFELNGRLITNDRTENYWDSVEGAELQFKFRN
ncbi:hypothetical protein [Aquipseudomonas ullengensis]|uniref:Translation initiation factor 2 n=1 Tax=Aquipseudomonas ullengensis TaxID=2759166 RepID=A0A7W4LKZ8_9GAMM|nr:hypothetical protein [Pseudomonas ullengensis]MBB2495072.1 hypothetical protein [Pseudomonas ullengensis]